MDKTKSTVLIIDDEEEMTRLLKIELESEGYATLVANDGEEGFKRIREEKPDVIVLDISMPGMDGYEVLTIMKADDELKDIPVVILSARTQEKDIHKGMNLGAEFYMTKPFESSELVQEIERIVNCRG